MSSAAEVLLGAPSHTLQIKDIGTGTSTIDTLYSSEETSVATLEQCYRGPGSEVRDCS